MRKANLMASSFLIVLAGAICLASLQLSLYGRRGPGPGFMGFLTGSLLFLLSGALLLKSLRSREAAGPDMSPRELRRGAGLVGLLVLYALVLETLGYVVDSFLLLLFLFALSGAMPWYAVVGSAAATSVGSYLLFAVGLKIGLPAGILTILR